MEESPQGENAFVAAPQRSASQFRRGCLAMAMIVAVALFLWTVLWPKLDGHYLGDAGRIRVDVAFDNDQTHVMLSDDAAEDSAGQRFDGSRSTTTVSFGKDVLQRQSLEFHPFRGGAGQYTLVSGCRSIALYKITPGTRFVAAHPYLTILVVTAGVLFFMGWVLNQKAMGEPEAIFPMWLAFFVAFFASTGVLGWAGNAGMFGFDGVPRSPVAQVIVQGAEWFLAVNDECTLLLGILAMFVLPQWCAYLAAGATGAARRSRFVVFAWRWGALFIAKAFISASAVLLGIVLVGSYYAWLNPEPLNVCANAMTALLLLILGVGIFCTVPLKKAEGQTVSRRVRRIHKWMRRKLRKPRGAVARQIELEVREAARRKDDRLSLASGACGRSQRMWKESLAGTASRRRKFLRAQRRP
ncbi:hypothetical protein LGM71_29940 [Burkholderia sp. AU33545]|uniref:hypothetical protein n=1 Tax=Burkholderia sp. AU33545 TaxID=2879631 RepID=UPI001CF303B3|nr:hypothetical protein [Burkholderia sp. AU33545]MCA8205266.1 hypothetical protein [Burkholderia sp. AU33545]